MSNALPHYLYRDPADVLERKQEMEARMSCSGCIHSFKMEFKSGAEMGCDKNRRYGKRCKLYEGSK